MLETGKAAAKGEDSVTITRESLQDGSLLAAFRSRVLPNVQLRSDAELEASLDEMLSAQDPAADAWVFGYGSLMWNPAFRYAEQRTGTLHGWHRRFCFWLRMGRGSLDNPGLMLALDRGGTCRGLAFRIPAADVRHEMLLVWRREMFGFTYLARWVTVRTEAGPVRAVTFVANRKSDRYAGRLGDIEIIERIATARGELGTCVSYLRQTVGRLHALGLRDAGLERLGRAVKEHHPASVVT